MRWVHATLICKLIIPFYLTISKLFWTFWLIMAEAKTWKNIENLSGKPEILLTKMRFLSKKVIENGQKMVWKTWNFYQKISGHPVWPEERAGNLFLSNILKKNFLIEKNYIWGKKCPLFAQMNTIMTRPLPTLSNV